MNLFYRIQYVMPTEEQQLEVSPKYISATVWTHRDSHVSVNKQMETYIEDERSVL
jgi:hypothetical protein